MKTKTLCFDFMQSYWKIYLVISTSVKKHKKQNCLWRISNIIKVTNKGIKNLSWLEFKSIKVIQVVIIVVK